MATYVFSDVHGRFAPLDRALSRISPSDDDVIYMLGDMVDRGRHSAEVLRLCHDMPNMVCLRGNHEEMMVESLRNSDDQYQQFTWGMNGGARTIESLKGLADDERDELVDWAAHLPLFAHTLVDDRPYLLVHAGIRPSVTRTFLEGLDEPPVWDADTCDALLSAQDPDDLLWIREGFWGAPTGLVGEDGKGPVVVAGHTPTIVVEQFADVFDEPSVVNDELCVMMRVGAGDKSGGVADRLAIDAGAGSVVPGGQVCILCLDTLEATYEPVAEED